MNEELIEKLKRFMSDEEMNENDTRRLRGEIDALLHGYTITDDMKETMKQANERKAVLPEFKNVFYVDDHIKFINKEYALLKLNQGFYNRDEDDNRAISNFINELYGS